MKIQLFRKITFTIISVSVVFLILEMSLRWLPPPRSCIELSVDPDLLGDLNPTGIHILDNTRSHYKQDFAGEDIWYDVFINNDGLRGPPVSHHRKKDTTRLLFLGDSVTFGFGVDEGHTLPDHCRTQWNDIVGSKVEVLNCGVPGYTIVDELEYYRQSGHLWKPDLVVLTIVPNDFPDLQRNQSLRTSHQTVVKNLKNNHGKTVIHRLLFPTHMYQLMTLLTREMSSSDSVVTFHQNNIFRQLQDMNALPKIRTNKEAPEYSETDPLPCYLYFFDQLLQEVQQDNIPMIALDITDINIQNNKRSRRIATQTDRLDRELTQRGIQVIHTNPYLDAAGDRTRTTLIEKGDSHPSGFGYQIMAQALLHNLITVDSYRKKLGISVETPIRQLPVPGCSLLMDSGKTSAGTIIVGHSGRMLTLQEETCKIMDTPTRSDLTSIIEIDHGTLLIGTINGTVFRLSNGSWSRETAFDNLSIIDFEKDLEGQVIACGTQGNLMKRSKTGNWSPFKPALPGNPELYSLLCARDGRIWVAGKNGFLAVYEKNTWQTVQTGCSEYLVDMVEDNNGNLIVIGTRGTAIHVQNGHCLPFHQFTGSDLFSITPLENDSIAIAGANGQLWLYENGKCRQINLGIQVILTKVFPGVSGFVQVSSITGDFYQVALTPKILH